MTDQDLRAELIAAGAIRPSERALLTPLRGSYTVLRIGEPASLAVARSFAANFECANGLCEHPKHAWRAKKGID